MSLNQDCTVLGIYNFDSPSSTLTRFSNNHTRCVTHIFLALQTLKCLFRTSKAFTIQNVHTENIQMNAICISMYTYTQVCRLDFKVRGEGLQKLCLQDEVFKVKKSHQVLFIGSYNKLVTSSRKMRREEQRQLLGPSKLPQAQAELSTGPTAEITVPRCHFCFVFKNLKEIAGCDSSIICNQF